MNGIAYILTSLTIGIISMALGLKLEKSLLTSSIRCIVQLTIMVSIYNHTNEFIDIVCNKGSNPRKCL
jgi:ABC-type iron transport system FetAB permease component